MSQPVSSSEKKSVEHLVALYLRQLPKDEERRFAFRGRVLAAAFSQLCGCLDLEPASSLGEGETPKLLTHSKPGSLDSDLSEAILAFVATPRTPFPSSVPGEPRVMAAHRLGELLDLLLSCESGGERRRLGSYFTPYEVARTLLSRSFEQLRPGLQRLRATSSAPLLTICDPACGGGAFLIEAVRQVAGYLCEQGAATEDAWTHAVRCAHGIDISSLATETTEAALYILSPRAGVAGARLLLGNVLIDRSGGKTGEALKCLQRLDTAPLDVPLALPEIFSGRSRGFDWVVGNPPWVAFQGRATQPISKELRAYYRERYFAFSGYPTTQGMFSERAVELAPHGAVSLLIPSSLSDLNGYAEARRQVSASHRVCEPLLEFGQDAFAQVVQPCFGLVAVARDEPTEGQTRPFVLEERARLSGEAEQVAVPACVLALAQRPALAGTTFGELGFQSNTQVVRHLFRRADGPQVPFTMGLLEGRCVQEFRQGSPRVYLHPDPALLREFKARLRDEAVYQRVDFVVRQTAAFTIAARHDGRAFRNSLIAGYASEEYDADLLVGLLNSALYRCFHLSRQRDARQATFPQVKVAHLRALPAPPDQGEPGTRVLRERVSALSRAANEAGGLSIEGRAALDQAVFALFGLSSAESRSVIDYLDKREPKALRPTLG